MRPHDHEPPPPRADISQVLDLLLAYNDDLAFADIQTARLWVNEGADIEKDILPTLKAVIERYHRRGRQGKIKTFSYFTNAVRDATERRRAGERVQAKRTPVHADADSVHRKARMAARTVRTFGIKDAIAIRFLEAYEREYGPVA